jgi:hypothetical protein
MIRKFLEIPSGWILDIPSGTEFFPFPSTGVSQCPVRCGRFFHWNASGRRERMRKKISIMSFSFVRMLQICLLRRDFAGAVSLAGFHVPDPAAAGIEIGRSLKPEAPLLMTAAYSGVRKISDL